MKDKIKQAAQAYYPEGTLHEVDKVKVLGFVRGANWAVGEIKAIIRKFIRDHSVDDYFDEITMSGMPVINYAKFENDLLKAIEDGHS